MPYSLPTLFLLLFPFVTCTNFPLATNLPVTPVPIETSPVNVTEGLFTTIEVLAFMSFASTSKPPSAVPDIFTAPISNSKLLLLLKVKEAPPAKDTCIEPSGATLKLEVEECCNCRFPLALFF